MTRLRVLHIITHLALGGATETVLASCRLSDPALVQSAILCGPTSAQEVTLAAQVAEMGVELHTLSLLRRSFNPFADSRALRVLAVWLRRGHWDIVHTHGSKAGVLGRLAAHQAGVPIIVHTVHGWGHHDRQHPFTRRLFVTAEQKAARVTDRLIVVAAANRIKGLADGIGHPAQYETIHSCINIAHFRDVQVDKAALRAALGVPRDAPVVGTVGRLAKQKAPGDFLRMAELVLQVRPDAHFVWVGGGPLEKAVRAKIAKMGLTERVHLLGYRHDVPELLRVFDVFALTSLWEGLPRVFAQAMCAALPIVATHVDGAAEAVTDGENGFLVAPRQPGAQAVQVLILLNDPARCRAMGENGLARVDPQFNERHMVSQMTDMYLSIAHEKGLLERDTPHNIDTPQEAALR